MATYLPLCKDGKERGGKGEQCSASSEETLLCFVVVMIVWLPYIVALFE